MATGGWGAAYAPNPFSSSSATLPTPNATVEVDRSAMDVQTGSARTSGRSSWLGGAWGGDKGVQSGVSLEARELQHDA